MSRRADDRTDAFATITGSTVSGGYSGLGPGGGRGCRTFLFRFAQNQTLCFARPARCGAGHAEPGGVRYITVGSNCHAITTVCLSRYSGEGRRATKNPPMKPSGVKTVRCRGLLASCALNAVEMRLTRLGLHSHFGGQVTWNWSGFPTTKRVNKAPAVANEKQTKIKQQEHKYIWGWL